MKLYRINIKSWVYNSVIEHLPIMCEALGSISSTMKKKSEDILLDIKLKICFSLSVAEHIYNHNDSGD